MISGRPDERRAHRGRLSAVEAAAPPPRHGKAAARLPRLGTSGVLTRAPRRSCAHPDRLTAADRSAPRAARRAVAGAETVPAKRAGPSTSPADAGRPGTGGERCGWGGQSDVVDPTGQIVVALDGRRSRRLHGDRAQHGGTGIMAAAVDAAGDFPELRVLALPGDSPVEHARPGTPRAAIAAGASHVVVGRKVTRAVDPASAFRLVRGGLRCGGGVRRPRSARLRRQVTGRRSGSPRPARQEPAAGRTPGP
ncbi:putative protein OS=Streptomyces griseomycini OX=66895 GN=FHS37_003191 PE=4 SV=1 [Streptomyces griseomycini]|uniref:Uncharacterized protein n=1 Tax=Streptomyces griseomycini TaxID=66895 RepID=A0A7W7M0I7_9ACTN|nr:hypothetical protein [Streptomyces griseomycini]